MVRSIPEYPWFGSIHGDDIAQGDIFEKFPVFMPPTDLAFDEASETTPEFQWEKQDLIVMLQRCDLQKDREKVDDVILCAVWKRSELDKTNDWMEEIRKGRNASFHVLAGSQLPGLESEPRVVDFRRVYALPVKFIRKRAQEASTRLRLMPPYREHLSQSFARFFMRVGLPTDIPSFKERK